MSKYRLKLSSNMDIRCPRHGTRAICFRSLKFLISSLKIDTGFLGFFLDSHKYEYQTFLCNNRVWRAQDFRRWFSAHQKCDVCKCFQDLIQSFALGYQKLQACTSKQCDFKYKKLSRKVNNYAYNSMNFDSLSAECDQKISEFESAAKKPPHCAAGLLLSISQDFCSTASPFWCITKILLLYRASHTHSTMPSQKSPQIKF